MALSSLKGSRGGLADESVLTVAMGLLVCGTSWMVHRSSSAGFDMTGAHYSSPDNAKP